MYDVVVAQLGVGASGDNGRRVLLLLVADQMPLVRILDRVQSPTVVRN